MSLENQVLFPIKVNVLNIKRVIMMGEILKLNIIKNSDFSICPLHATLKGINLIYGADKAGNSLDMIVLTAPCPWPEEGDYVLYRKQKINGLDGIFLRIVKGFK